MPSSSSRQVQLPAAQLSSASTATTIPDHAAARSPRGRDAVDFAPIFQLAMLPPRLRSIATTEAMLQVLETLADTFASDGGRGELTLTTHRGDERNLSQEARQYAAQFGGHAEQRRRWLVGTFLLEQMREAMLPAFTGKGRTARGQQDADVLALQAAAVLGQKAFLDLEHEQLGKLPGAVGNVPFNGERVAVRVEDGAVLIEKSLDIAVSSPGQDVRSLQQAEPVRLDTALVLMGKGEELVAVPAYVKISDTAGGSDSPVPPEFVQSWLQGLIDALLRLLFGAVCVQPGSARVTAQGVVFEPAAPRTENEQPCRDLVAFYKPGWFGGAPRSVMAVTGADVAVEMGQAPTLQRSGAPSYATPSYAPPSYAPTSIAAPAEAPEPAAQAAAQAAAIAPVAPCDTAAPSAAAASPVSVRPRTRPQPFQYSVSCRADEGVLADCAATIAQGVLAKFQEDDARPGNLKDLVVRDFVGGIAQTAFPVTFDGVDLLDQSAWHAPYRLLRALSRARLLEETQKAAQLESELRGALQDDPEWRTVVSSETTVSGAARSLLSRRFLDEVTRRYPDPDMQRVVLWACTQCAPMEPWAFFQVALGERLQNNGNLTGASNGKLSERTIDIRAEGRSLVVEAAYEQACDRVVREDGSDLAVDPTRNRIRYYVTLCLDPGRVAETCAVLEAGYEIEMRDAIHTAARAVPVKAPGLSDSWVMLSSL
ncbi:hypothetical protein [Cupriavidus sp. AU9028]|uniref:hypothetical protein n=1 Tax=Cupriavidus sp. AU9028 TaxID=2871157 RepID=UPI001C9453C3|nr:hypothetical protein [Cupriavidus sp. AU9028]MBY4896389.1 hypothetical protein [Cupriavidus sp. AU9028]